MTTEFNDLFETFFNEKKYNDWQDDIDIVESDNSVAIVLDVPGYESDGIDISTENNILKITGKRKLEEQTLDGKTFLRRDRTSTSFTKSFKLSDNFDKEKITAKLKNGVLRIEIEKFVPNERTPKKIAIQQG